MSDKSILPNNCYRIATAISLIVVIGLSYASHRLSEDFWIFCMIAVAVSESAIFIKKYKRDNLRWYELFQSCVLPLSLYFLLYLSEMRGLKRTLITGLVVLLIISLFYLGILIAVNVAAKNKWNNASYIKKVVAIGLYNIQSLIVIVLSLEMIYMAFVFPIFQGSSPNESQALKAWSEERTIAGHYETLKILGNEDEFADITDSDKRYEVFSHAVDVESNYLGIPYEISVKTGDLNEGVCAKYCDFEKCITIDEKYLMECTAGELIRTAAHECRHAYQWELIRLYEKVKDDEESMIFLDQKLVHVKDYINEFKDYKDGNDNIEEYADQYCEKDSYIYAEASYENWIEKLEELEKSNG